MSQFSSLIDGGWKIWELPEKYNCQWTLKLFLFAMWPHGFHMHHADTRHLQIRFELLCLLFCIVRFLPAGTHKFVTEGEHMELKAITKEQSGSYECIASNDISSPDVRTVQVTVNCKRQGAGLCRDQINKYRKIQSHPGDKYGKIIKNMWKLFDDKW